MRKIFVQYRPQCRGSGYSIRTGKSWHLGIRSDRSRADRAPLHRLRPKMLERIRCWYAQTRCCVGPRSDQEAAGRPLRVQAVEASGDMRVPFPLLAFFCRPRPGQVAPRPGSSTKASDWRDGRAVPRRHGRHAESASAQGPVRVAIRRAAGADTRSTRCLACGFSRGVGRGAGSIAGL